MRIFSRTIPKVSHLQVTMLDYEGEGLLAEEGGNPVRLARTAKSVTYEYLSRIYQGIGFCNINGGMEFYSKETGIVTIGQSGLLHIPIIKGVTTRNCCLFANIMDYIAYSAMTKAIRHDCLILSSPSNFEQMCALSRKYNKANLYFPDTLVGQVITQTIRTRLMPQVAISVSPISDGLSLYEIASNEIVNTI